mmetsp:Transcript_48659/g.130234  ORF Transcript_48659/g.130234 Transcript_48659/m.130234 type:complete len:203 (-) Transcript_48659:495-1103(-)
MTAIVPTAAAAGNLSAIALRVAIELRMLAAVMLAGVAAVHQTLGVMVAVKAMGGGIAIENSLTGTTAAREARVVATAALADETTRVGAGVPAEERRASASGTRSATIAATAEEAATGTTALLATPAAAHTSDQGRAPRAPTTGTTTSRSSTEGAAKPQADADLSTPAACPHRTRRKGARNPPATFHCMVTEQSEGLGGTRSG